MGDESQTGGDVVGSSAHTRATLVRGARLGPYVIGEELGRGGMGRVLRAHDERLDRDVALKLLDGMLGRRAPIGPEAEARIRREAQALAQLDHPNVVRVFDVAVIDGVPFIALEYVRGVTLRVWLSRKRRPLDEILRVFVDAGRGLVAVHNAGLVHRDFKPGNVMISEDGRARVMDFGLARLGDPEAISSSSSFPCAPDVITQSGTVVGTPSYMAPEQHRGETADARADQFAFAVALFEAVHGRHPFASTHDGFQLALAKHSGRFVAVPTGVVPRWLDAALRRALSATPADRFPNMDALVQVLRRGDRRRRAAIAFTGLGLFAMLGAIALPSAAEPTRCDPETALGDAWTPDRAAAIASAWANGTSPFAQTTAPDVTAALDDYAERWSGAWQTTCEAMSTNAAELDGAMACLASARRDLGATATALAGELDARGAEQAMASIVTLPDPAHCRRIAHTRVAERPGEAELREALAHAKANTRARRFAEAERILDDVEGRIAATRRDAIAAELLLRRAELASAKGDHAAARAEYEAAWHAAAAAGEDVIATTAVTSLIDLVGAQLAHPVDALRIVPDAEALAARVGDPNLDARLDRAIGRTLSANADHRGAAERLQRALEVRVTLEPVDAIELAVIHDSLARAIERSGDHPRAVEHVQHAIAVAEAALGPDHPHVAQYMGNLATLESKHGNQDDAERIVKDALARLERSVGPNHRAASPLLNTLGIAYRMRGEFAKAAEYHERLLVLERATTGDHDVNVARARSNLAEDLVPLGRFDEAYAHAAAALVVVEEILGRDHPQFGSVEDTLGAIEHGRGNEEGALVHYQHAVDNWRRVYGEYDGDVANGWVNVGAIQLNLERWADARASYEHSIAAFERSDAVDTPHAAGGYAGLARALTALGEPPERRIALLERAIELYGRGGPDPRWLGSMRLELAEALWSRRSERRRALALASEALAGIEGLHDADAEIVRAGVTTWLARRRATRPRT